MLASLKMSNSKGLNIILALENKNRISVDKNDNAIK